MPVSHSGRDVSWTLRQREKGLSWRQRFPLLFYLVKPLRRVASELLLSIDPSGTALIIFFFLICSTFCENY